MVLSNTVSNKAIRSNLRKYLKKDEFELALKYFVVMAKIYETGGYQIKEKIHLPVTLPSSLFNTQFSFYHHLTIIPENEMVKLEKEKKNNLQIRGTCGLESEGINYDRRSNLAVPNRSTFCPGKSLLTI